MAWMIVSGMVSLQPMALSDCEAKQLAEPSTLCVMVEEPCIGAKDCGIQVKKKPYKRIYYHKNGRLLYRVVRR